MDVEETTTMTATKDRICIVGSGNWGSAIATIIGRNCARLSCFETTVQMWVYEEEVLHQGKQRKLSELINTLHENTKYLPGVQIPGNVHAEPNLEVACRDATVLVFVLPHQFLPKLLPQIRKVVHPTCRCVSLIKGLGMSRKQ
jgi:glycerol-3-phosphate dehydrogenase (NAD+)